MDIPFSRYTEKLPEEFSVRHKITETTEKRISTCTGRWKLYLLCPAT